MNKTKQLFASLILMVLNLGTAFAEECPADLKEGNVCLPKGFPLEATPSSYPLNLMEGVTKVSNEVYDLHMLIMWICVFIGVGVFGTMFYSMYHHRKSKGHEAAHFHENAKLEFFWTLVPTLILVAMAIPATRVLIDLNKIPVAEKGTVKAESGKDYDMTIKVTGHQWYWEYEYLDNNIKFLSKMDKLSDAARQQGSTIDPKTVPHYLLRVDKPVVIPTKKKIRFVFTSADVVHSWWVPDLGWKKDTNPGFINEAWTQVDKPGVFRGQCTELCGRGHAFMPVVLIAMDQADYDKWLSNPDGTDAGKVVHDADVQSHDELVAEGSKLYEEHCVSCHQAKGEGIPGAFPAITGSKVVTGDITAQTKLVLDGKAMMPAFAKTLKPYELAQIITFTRNGLGNKVGDEIQPKAINEMLGSGKSAAPTKESAPEKSEAESKAEAPAKEAAAKKDVADSKKTPATEKKAATPEKSATASTLSKEDLIAKGKTVYNSCAGCHGADGKGGMGPAITGNAMVKGDINAQVKFMMVGKGMMPPVGKTLSPTDFAAVVTYTRNALGNSVGDSIQPSAIEAVQSVKPTSKVDEDE